MEISVNQVDPFQTMSTSNTTKDMGVSPVKENTPAPETQESSEQQDPNRATPHIGSNVDVSV